MPSSRRGKGWGTPPAVAAGKADAAGGSGRRAKEGRVVAFAGRARFTGVNSGGGERMGDEVCGVEHPDTKRAGELRGRDSSGAEPPGLPPRGRRFHVSQTVVCDTC